MKKGFSLAAVALLASLSQAAPIVRGNTDLPPADYSVRQPVHFQFYASEDGQPLAARFKVTLRADGLKDPVVQILESTPDKPAELVWAAEVPGFAKATAVLVDEADQPLKFDGKTRAFTLGAGADVSLLSNVPEPDDFDAFWAAAKAQVDAVDLALASIEPVSAENAAKAPKFNLYKFRVPLGEGNAPATGFLFIPKKFPNEPLACVAQFNGYGNGGQTPQNWYSGEEKLFILQVNAHGFELERPADYYRSFFNAISNGGEGGGYGFRNAENADPQTCYFRGMIVRDLLALRLAKSLPQFDGKNLTVQGGSQGGFQSLALAALDPSVSCANIEVPWLCDLGGAEELGHIRGWLPKYQPSLRYFDTVNFAKRVSCPVDITRCGLADGTCPPTGIQALYNALKGPKSIRYVQNSDHMNFGPIPKELQQQLVRYPNP